MSLPSRNELIQAMKRRDRSFDGRAWMGVRTTGIYCLFSCKAKRPNPDNVIFYASREEAIASGFRACLRCHPERYPDTLPDWYRDLLTFMRSETCTRLTEADIREAAGVHITTVRRLFKDRLGVSPLAFHRKIRLLRARALLLDGIDPLTVAWECGYESSSGFRDAFTKTFGLPPGRLRERSDSTKETAQ